MKIRSFAFIFIIVLSTSSIILNLFFGWHYLYKEKHNTAKFTKTNSLVTQVTAKFEKAYKIPEEKIHSVYVKPHPPAFLEGRELHYKDYYVQEKDGQKKVTFLEIHANKWIHTTVSSEAIVWK